MPDTSPILGLPIAKGTDPLKQFPSTVDSPRTLALENFIANPARALLGLSADITSWTPGAFNTVVFNTTPELTGGMTVVGGGIQVPAAGRYVVGVGAHTSTLATETNTAYGLFRGSTEVTRFGQITPPSHKEFAAAAARTIAITTPASEVITLRIFLATTGGTVVKDTWLQVTRVG